MNKWRLLRSWHRWLGLGITVFVLLLSITGVMLNHAEKLRLNNVTIDAGWLMSWYGIEGLSDDAVSFELANQWITSGSGWLYLNDRVIATTDELAMGAVQTELLTLVASGREVILFTHPGELVERYVPSEFTDAISRVGLAQGRLVLHAGGRSFQANENAALWTHFDGETVWSESKPVPNHLIPAINHHLRGNGLPLYRLVLDVHSGRFFAASGPLIMDAVAVILILLNGLGIWLWWARR